mgnify:CR=1 FL=1
MLYSINMETRPLTIVHVAPAQDISSGDFVYRVRQPDEALSSLPGVAVASINNICTCAADLCTGADLLVLQLLGDPDMLPIVDYRRKKGLPTVFEISDNFLDFQADNPASRFYEQPENRAVILHLISMCDAAQATVPAIAEKFAPYNRRVEVFQNPRTLSSSPETASTPSIETFVAGVVVSDPVGGPGLMSTAREG